MELHNVGSQALILNLGIMLANGREQYPNRIRLQLTEPSSRLLHLEMTGPGAIGGRVDPMVVPLPANATFALLIDLEHYCAPSEKVWKLNLTSGHYTLRAEYTGAGVSQQATNLDMKGVTLMPYWTGTVESSIVSFTVK